MVPVRTITHTNNITMSQSLLRVVRRQQQQRAVVTSATAAAAASFSSSIITYNNYPRLSSSFAAANAAFTTTVTCFPITSTRTAVRYSSTLSGTAGGAHTNRNSNGFVAGGAMALAGAGAMAIACTSDVSYDATGTVSVCESKTAGSAGTTAAAAAAVVADAAAAAAAAKLEFQIMAALEMKEELQKVRLAQVVNDLKKIAAQAAEENNVADDESGSNSEKQQVTSRVGLRKYVTMVVDSISTRRKKNQQQQNSKNSNKSNDGKSKSKDDNDDDEHNDQPYISMHGESISLRDVNLFSIVPENATKIITALRDGGRLNKNSIMKLVQTARLVLSYEPTVIDLTNRSTTSKSDEDDDDDILDDDIQGPKRVTVVGDLHGSLSCLHTILRAIGDLTKDPNHIVVFDGDFVDRGLNSVEVLATLLLLKLTHPKQVYLLRGNHEDSHVAAVYGFQDEVRLKYGSSTSQDLWDNLSELFAALPLAAVTDQAFIVHGGIPSFEFSIDDLRQISPMQRQQYITTMDDPEYMSQEHLLITDCLWSDPSDYHQGVLKNPRGVGKSFGPDVAQGFLQKHQLRYIIRGHEPCQNGFAIMPCNSSSAAVADPKDAQSSKTTVRKDSTTTATAETVQEDTDGPGVITVFSNAAYPGGQGTNLGAYLTLETDGTYTKHTFSYEDSLSTLHPPQEVEQKKQEQNDNHQKPGNHHAPLQAVTTIRGMIGANRSKLERAFKELQFFEGYVTIDEWANTLSHVLELDRRSMPWEALLPSLAPNCLTSDEKYIDWKACLNHNSGISLFEDDDDDDNNNENNNNNGIRKKKKELHQEEILLENHQLLLTIFKYLDVDKNGYVNEDEFNYGIWVLNKRLPEDRQLQDVASIFKVLDHKNTGYIDFDEFARLFRFM